MQEALETNGNDADQLEQDVDQFESYLEYSRVVWSSARLLSFLITSQMTQTKINMNQLRINFTQSTEPITKLISTFMQPFLTQISNRNISVEISEGNPIPNWVRTDWQIY
jgi:hypothetical protein